MEWFERIGRYISLEKFPLLPPLCLPEPGFRAKPGGSIDLSSARSRPRFSHILSRRDRSRRGTVSWYRPRKFPPGLRTLDRGLKVSLTIGGVQSGWRATSWLAPCVSSRVITKRYAGHRTGIYSAFGDANWTAVMAAGKFSDRFESLQLSRNSTNFCESSG